MENQEFIPSVLQKQENEGLGLGLIKNTEKLIGKKTHGEIQVFTGETGKNQEQTTYERVQSSKFLKVEETNNNKVFSIISLQDTSIINNIHNWDNNEYISESTKNKVFDYFLYEDEGFHRIKEIRNKEFIKSLIEFDGENQYIGVNDLNKEFRNDKEILDILKENQGIILDSNSTIETSLQGVKEQIKIYMEQNKSMISDQSDTYFMVIQYIRKYIQVHGFKEIDNDIVKMIQTSITPLQIPEIGKVQKYALEIVKRNPNFISTIPIELTKDKQILYTVFSNPKNISIISQIEIEDTQTLDYIYDILINAGLSEEEIFKNIEFRYRLKYLINTYPNDSEIQKFLETEKELQSNKGNQVQGREDIPPSENEAEKYQTVIQSHSGEAIKISEDEQQTIQNNPEALQNLINFHDYFTHKVNLPSVWKYRADILNTIGDHTIDTQDDSISKKELTKIADYVMQLIHGKDYKKLGDMDKITPVLRKYSQFNLDSEKVYGLEGYDRLEYELRGAGIIDSTLGFQKAQAEKLIKNGGLKNKK